MSLLDIKKYLLQVKMTSLASACTYFNIDADLLRQMLGHWIQKGCVRQCMKTPACGSKCGKCVPETTEIYEWVGG
jgi:putative ferrous iron transport protein C